MPLRCVLLLLLTLQVLPTSASAAVDGVLSLAETLNSSLNDATGFSICRGIAISEHTALTSLHCLVDPKLHTVRKSLYVAGQPIQRLQVNSQSRLVKDPADSVGDFVILYLDQPYADPTRATLAHETRWSDCHLLIKAKSLPIQTAALTGVEPTGHDLIKAHTPMHLELGDSGSPVFCPDFNRDEKLVGLLSAIGPEDAGGQTVLVQRLDIYSDWIQTYLK